MKGKIYLRIFGGLGNQQFQYAYSKALAKLLNRKLVLDASYFNKLYFPKRKYGFYAPFELSNFNITETFTKGFLHHLLGVFAQSGRLLKKYQLYRNKFFFSSNLPYIVFNEDDDLTKIPDSCPIILNGYFQKSNIFHDIREKLLNDLSLIDYSNLDSIKDILQFEDGGSVSVHIRRGDYVSVSRINKRYTALTKNYFQKAIEFIKLNRKVSKIIVFSNDIDWVKNNIDFDINTLYIDKSFDLTDLEEQHLMSRCDHNIISNSTFAWWGAYLNGNPHKIVCAPDHWYSKHLKLKNVFYPNDWVVINTSEKITESDD